MRKLFAILALPLCLAAQSNAPLFGPNGNSGFPIIGRVNRQVNSYSAQCSDSGALVTFNSASNVSLMLPNPVCSSAWVITTENVGTGTLTVNPNTLNLDDASSNLSLSTGQGVMVYTNGSGYYTMRGLAGSGGGGTGTFSMLTVSSAAYFGTAGTAGCVNIGDATTPTAVNSPICSLNTGPGLTINTTLQAVFTFTPSLVSALPTCNAGHLYQTYVATDANSPTFLATVAGGGTGTPAPVVCNGTNWKVF